MSQTVTLTLPDSFFQPLLRTAQATQQSLEKLLLTALQTSLPPLDGLPKDLAEHLTVLETLSDQQLQLVLRETVPKPTQTAISRLLARQQQRPLDATERQRLDALQHEADLVMLRKARAAVLLRFRGHRLPTLAELSQSAETDA